MQKPSHRSLITTCFTVVLASTLFLPNFATLSSANAGSKNIGSRKNNSLFLKQQRLKNAVELNRLGFDRSGVLLKPGAINNGLRLQKGKGFKAIKNVRIQEGELQLFERRRLNALRNIALKEQRANRLQQNGGSEVIFLDPTLSSGSGNRIAGPTSACPDGYNCGYRLYGDSTGPRIITPGVGGPANGLPQYDGVNGPLIIQVR